MENFASILERDYGFKSGKNAPMVSGSSGGGGGGGGGSYGSGLRKSVPSGRVSGNAGGGVYIGQDDPFSVGAGGGGRKINNEGSKSGRYGSRDDLFTPATYDDVFGGPPKSSGSEAGARYDDVFGGAASGAPVYDDLLGGYGGSTPTKVNNKSASGSFHSSPRRSDRNHFASPDPVYDELIPGFGFLPKPRASTETAKVSPHATDPFVSVGSDPLASTSAMGSSTTPFDDDGLLPGFESSSKSRAFSGGDSRSSSSRHNQPDPPLVPMFDDPIPSNSIPHSASSPAFEDDGLLPGFSTEGAKSRSFREAKAPIHQDSFGSLGGDDPIISSSTIPSGSSPPFDDLLNVFNEPQVAPSGTSSSRASRANGVKVDRYDSFDSFPQSPANSSFFNDSSSRKQSAEDLGRNTSRSPEDSAREGFPDDDISGASPDSDDPFFPSQTVSGKSATLGTSDTPDEEKTAWDSPVSFEPQPGDRGSNEGSNRSTKEAKEWVTVEDLKLMTKPSPVPPPRRPPPLPGSRGSRFKDKSDSRDAEFVTSSAPSTSTPDAEDVMGSRSNSTAAPPSYEQAVPGWMDFKIQPNRDEEREREEARAARERRRQEREEAKAAREAREREMKEREARQAREQERLRREKEREKDRAAVRIATLEARERAAQEARDKAERSAVEKVTGEARERAASQARMRVERAAVERANAEARERAEVRAAVEKAQAEARERAEKAAAEKAAVERAASEARERSAHKAAADRAAVERAQSEARERAARSAAEKAAVERAAAEARERAERAAAEKAAAARERERERERSQQTHRKSENDLESFFGHSSSVPASGERQRPASMNNPSNVFGGSEPRRTSSGTAATAASVDDWTTIFGATPSADDSQDRRGDSGRMSRGRTDRLAHTRERAARAIAEINQRDLELQREQAEKSRAGDVLDAEIKRWAAGKEGNLRALLSTLQYVLWPECGWTPVSLTDLINPASVKKTYRKATLYVHPDKVQQKGATVQQKYIAEKVFDLLKEASNKFNSEELF